MPGEHQNAPGGSPGAILGDFGVMLGSQRGSKNHEKRGKKAMENRNCLGTVSGGVFNDFGDEKTEVKSPKIYPE